MAHQEEGVAWTLERVGKGLRWCPLFMETGTGKTLTALKLMEEWRDMGRRKFLIVCPKPLIDMWSDEAEKWQFPMNVLPLNVDGTAARKKLLKQPFDVLITNYDSVRIMKEEFMAMGFECLIFDELHKIKNRDSKATLACRELAIAVAQRQGLILGLTGTPIANNPLDVWSEFDVLDPHANYFEHPLGYGSFASFESQVCVKTIHPHVKGIFIYKFPPEAVEELHTRIAKHAFIKNKADCLDLPGQLWTPIKLTLTAEQQRIYKALVQDSVAYVNDRSAGPSIAGIQSMHDFVKEWVSKNPKKRGTALETDRVSVALQTVLLLRLQQVASGHIKTDDGRVRTLDSIKLDYLEEQLPKYTGGDNKLVVISRFRHDIAKVAELCAKLKVGYYTVTGDNSNDAQRLAQDFQKNDKIRVFIGQVQAASTGLTLTAANRMVFFSNSYNHVDRKQSEDRIHRISQTRPVEYIDLLGRGTVDEYALARLQQKKSLAVHTVNGFVKLLQGDLGIANDSGEVAEDILDLW